VFFFLVLVGALIGLGCLGKLSGVGTGVLFLLSVFCGVGGIVWLRLCGWR